MLINCHKNYNTNRYHYLLNLAFLQINTKVGFDNFTRMTFHKMGTETHSIKETLTTTRHNLWLKTLNETKYKFKKLPSSLFPMKSSELHSQSSTHAGLPSQESKVTDNEEVSSKKSSKDRTESPTEAIQLTDDSMNQVGDTSKDKDLAPEELTRDNVTIDESNSVTAGVSGTKDMAKQELKQDVVTLKGPSDNNTLNEKIVRTNGPKDKSLSTDTSQDKDMKKKESEDQVVRTNVTKDENLKKDYTDASVVTIETSQLGVVKTSDSKNVVSITFDGQEIAMTTNKSKHDVPANESKEKCAENRASEDKFEGTNTPTDDSVTSKSSVQVHTSVTSKDDANISELKDKVPTGENVVTDESNHNVMADKSKDKYAATEESKGEISGVDKSNVVTTNESKHKDTMPEPNNGLVAIDTPSDIDEPFPANKPCDELPKAVKPNSNSLTVDASNDRLMVTTESEHQFETSLSKDNILSKETCVTGASKNDVKVCRAKEEITKAENVQDKTDVTKESKHSVIIDDPKENDTATVESEDQVFENSKSQDNPSCVTKDKVETIDSPEGSVTETEESKNKMATADNEKDSVHTIESMGTVVITDLLEDKSVPIKEPVSTVHESQHNVMILDGSKDIGARTNESNNNKIGESKDEVVVTKDTTTTETKEKATATDSIKDKTKATDKSKNNDVPMHGAKNKVIGISKDQVLTKESPQHNEATIDTSKVSVVATEVPKEEVLTTDKSKKSKADAAIGISKDQVLTKESPQHNKGTIVTPKASVVATEVPKDEVLTTGTSKKSKADAVTIKKSGNKDIRKDDSKNSVVKTDQTKDEINNSKDNITSETKKLISENSSANRSVGPETMSADKVAPQEGSASTEISKFPDQSKHLQKMDDGPEKSHNGQYLRFDLGDITSPVSPVKQLASQRKVFSNYY